MGVKDLIKMNDEQMRIAIAEACGWKPDDDGAGLNTWEASWVGNKLYGLRPTFRPDRTISSYTVDCVVPDYLNDLNAMHEAEKSAGFHENTSEGRRLTQVYAHNLGYSVSSWKGYATAAQRAEAFIKTLNLEPK